MKTRGLKIIAFLEKSYGRSIGLLVGDIIFSLNHIPLSSPEVLNENIQINLGSEVVYSIFRNNEKISISCESKPLNARLSPTTFDNSKVNKVVVTDINMPFGSMVLFMVKLAIAAIPAFLILLVLSAVVFSLFNGLFT